MLIQRPKRAGLLQINTLTDLQAQNSGTNLQELKEGLTTLSSKPRRLVLELTNVCNFNCITCGRSSKPSSQHFLDMKDLAALTPFFPYLEEVTLFGWGEGTLHPQFTDIVDLFSKNSTRIYFVTNGSTLNQLQDLIINTPSLIMGISLDGFTAKTNDRIRQGSDFNKIIYDLQNIVRIKKERHLSSPYINVVMTLMRSNIDELPGMINLAHKMSLDEVKGIYLTSFDKKLAHESLWNSQDHVKKIFNQSHELAQKYKIKLKLPHIQGEDSAKNNYHKGCFNAWRDLFIGADGYIRYCQSHEDRLFSIIERRHNLESMWNGPEMQKFRTSVNNKNLMSSQCQKCYQSSHANWNKKHAFFQTNKPKIPDGG